MMFNILIIFIYIDVKLGQITLIDYKLKILIYDKKNISKL